MSQIFTPNCFPSDVTKLFSFEFSIINYYIRKLSLDLRTF